MTTIDFAHIREQGQNILIAPLDHSFHDQAAVRWQETGLRIELAARNAGLLGTVVLVWETPSGGMNFLAPWNWHPFFESIDLSWVITRINRTVNW